MTTPVQIFAPPEPEFAAPTVPQNREAEEATCGAVLINPSAFYEVTRLIKSSDFYIHRLRWIWEAFESLTLDRSEIDLLTVADRLEHNGLLAEIGGPAYLTGLINSVPTSLNVEHYAGIVREMSERRTGIALANQQAQAAYAMDTDFSLSDCAMKIATAARSNTNRISTDDAASKMIDLVLSPKCYSTGIKDIDDKVGGIFPEELSVLAGYQGTGKSAEKLQAAFKNADNGCRVLLCDLEMTAAQTWFRKSCGDLGIDVNQVRSGRVSDDAQKKVMNYAADLAKRYRDKIVIYQAPMSPADILSATMIEQPDIVYVDTLKNIGGKPGRETQQGWYDFVLNFLRINVAQRTGVHVQVLHHLSRDAAKNNREPNIHDLMFAGESDADAIFILYRKQDDYAVVADGAIKTVVPIKWITGKSRFGRVKFTFFCDDLAHTANDELPFVTGTVNMGKDNEPFGSPPLFFRVAPAVHSLAGIIAFPF